MNQIEHLFLSMFTKRHYIERTTYELLGLNLLEYIKLSCTCQNFFARWTASNPDSCTPPH